ncbi:hypothetical protein AMAG_06222 [Allomyces macrogynus ATCC 38327]|uniref:Endonuclease V n=1 Tax=Allomyces macrogynus (strain ATCC 38327) TaxID=578462 RepID=A0A0L0SG13_ALLM3|nr:hypothetical protein AMAG_06222 [Allomyces macrogynus ATCC 38327]|eukprot:KNE61392.1 hypothetical protein AMAG_06222 [Allomyces macrogynus ATCC 38327]
MDNKVEMQVPAKTSSVKAADGPASSTWADIVTSNAPQVLPAHTSQLGPGAADTASRKTGPSTTGGEDEAHRAIRDQWQQEQLALRAQLVDVDDPADLQATLCYVAGVDISFVETPPDDAPPGTPFTQSAIAYVAVLSWPALDVVYTAHNRVVLDLPYIATFLAFREVGPLAKLVHDIPEQLKPQVIFVDGNGVLHPRRFGLASHLGVVTGIPTIGVAKNFLQIANEGPEMTMRHVKAVSRTKLHRGGDQMPLIGTSGTVYGMAVLPCDGATNPIFVSVGHKVSLASAVAIVLQSCKFRIPEPIRVADLKSRELIRQLQRQEK